VLDRNLVVQVWTRQAHELWGLRADETIDHHLLNLDSGMPNAELHPWLRAVITGQQHAVVGRRIRAVNRRGRNVDLRVTVTALQTDGDQPAGALILMEDISQTDRDKEPSDRGTESSGSGSMGSATEAES
jgi:two-component system CheB/CheR fusion protein